MMISPTSAGMNERAITTIPAATPIAASLLLTFLVIAGNASEPIVTTPPSKIPSMPKTKNIFPIADPLFLTREPSSTFDERSAATINPNTFEANENNGRKY
jgi:hypothetical protein